MMGILLTGPSYIFAHNKYQVTNSTIPKSTLKKKCNSICYHAVQESVAMDESLITHINSEDNLSDLMTKVTRGGKRHQLVGNILHDIMMTILNIEARPANPDQPILRGLKKYAHSYLLYLLTCYVLAERVEYTKDTFASTSLEICAPGRLYFRYSVFPGVMSASLMRSHRNHFFQTCNSFY